jgi:hydroxypyruvate isomerase
MSGFSLAACAEMLWRDRAIEWRASRLNEMGFGVGLWDWPALTSFRNAFMV